MTTPSFCLFFVHAIFSVGCTQFPLFTVLCKGIFGHTGHLDQQQSLNLSSTSK